MAVVEAKRVWLKFKHGQGWSSVEVQRVDGCTLALTEIGERVYEGIGRPREIVPDPEGFREHFPDVDTKDVILVTNWRPKSTLAGIHDIF